MDEAKFDAFILANMPHFIAIHYQRLLKTQQPQEQVELIVQIYNLVLRTLTIILVSQYLIRDRERVSDPDLDRLLLQNFRRFTPESWEKILFTSLMAYEGKQDLFFISELYNFYWETSTFPHKERVEVRPHFYSLTQAATEVRMKKSLPQDELSWKKRAQELEAHLRQVLLSLSFLGQYDLIRVLNLDEQFYSFEMYKGVHLSSGRQPLPLREKLSAGWFYLRSEKGDILLLHPLLVFWEGELEKDELAPTNTGIFDRRAYEGLQYILALSGQEILDQKLVQAFVTLVDDTIAEIKRKRREAEKLTWLELRDICADITWRRMATVRKKYRKELYLQRENVFQKFEAFLDDPEKRCFVLVGKSGVGKSNFLLALGEELSRSRGNVCVLMYDGANVEAAISFTEIISQDFSDRLILSGRSVQQVWHEIAEINDIEERLVLLFVDALNENPQARKLLVQLDALVQRPWPWLKVVFTSRPETWQTIKHGVKLAEAFYYQEQGADILGVDPEPFSSSEQMEPFSRQELPKVYRKYQQVYELQTPYESLSSELLEILPDPLNLRLAAKAYKGKFMPDKLKETTLIEEYVNTLLPGETRWFLEKHLVPLMVREGHYSNVITTADLDAAGGALYEAVLSEQVLSDGQVANRAFRDLLDADILVWQEQGTDPKIAFKYERFYEYFVGKRIAELSETQRDRYSFFLNLIKEITNTPFLWGAVRNTLIQEAKKPGIEIFLKLCRTTEQSVKEMMVSVLTTLGLDMLEPVEEMLKNLIPQGKKVTEWRKGQQLLGKSSQTSDITSRYAGRIALEVASNLGIGWALQRGAIHGDPSLRTEAVRYSYHLWQQDQAKGFVILEYLAERAVHGFLPDILALESTLGLSLIIFFDHYQDKSVLAQLQSIWRTILAKLLRIRERSSQRENVMRIFIREKLISLVYTVAFRIMDSLPDYSTVTYKGIEKFFKLGITEKALYRNLVQYLNVQGNYSREQMEHDYLEALKVNDALLVLIAVIGLVAHAYSSPLLFLPFLKKMFAEARNTIASPHLANVVKALECILDRDPMIDEIFDFFVYALEVCHQYYGTYPQALLTREATAPEKAYLGPYSFYQYQRTGTARTAWLAVRIQEALSQNRIPFFDQLLSTELVHVGIELQKPLVALDVLGMFFHSNNPAIDQLIQSFLSRLRMHYPDEVDTFLEEQHASANFSLQVRIKEPTETIGGLIGQNAWYFMRDEIIMKSPELRSQLMLVFDKAADCKDLRAWLDYFIRQIVNSVYGEEVLRLSHR